ncbi:hypothetical protein DICPUDRAFT_151554 [Dictyostelium purpureum]|uniref:Uncharacterized protein n=1 Tax=Dictyostelium purpureum TaxID=5786 RepID=F0ZJ51_DICPU|nr:uncharacterized protein DICPUDRAFT_151554 [Dictyostelium purpureum]EGC36005.1 hypothetical protein DICPUDRAFT_151554 [Dictyostelium purpureum]|eukprot:XP_003287443.1 hypothetical protein DICPUDRAFT_151554 [Dictyostelium purpureum]
MAEDDNNNIFSVKNIKHCEAQSKSKKAFEELSECVEKANNLPEEENHLPQAVQMLQYYFPRIFTTDLPRERTFIADGLAWLMPKVFDPQEDDDEDDN